MTPRTFRISLAVIALAVILTLACGCRPEPAAPAAVPVDEAPMIYYLFPGDIAPVEGPQLEAADFEKLLDRLDAAEAELARLKGGQ